MIIAKKRIDFKDFLCLIIIRELYLFLTLYILKDLWYIGYGSYGIDFELKKELLGLLSFVLVSLYYLSIRKKGVFTDCVLRFLFIIYFIPLNCAYALNNMSLSFWAYSSLFYFLTIFLVRHFVPDASEHDRKDSKRSGYFENCPALQWICLVVCCLCIVSKIMYNGFSFSLSLGGDYVYSQRAEFQSSMDSISGGAISYIFSIVRNLASFVAPVYLYYSLKHRKVFPSIISILCVLSIYAMSASKGTLFITLWALLILVLEKLHKLKNINRLFTYLVICGLIVCLLERLVLHTDRIYMLLVRRVMYYPAWLNTIYYDFFSVNSKVLWTQDTFLLQNILPSVYNVSPLELISNKYYQGLIPSPNTGLFAEAFMNFGVFGILLYPAIIAVMLKLSNKLYNRCGIGIAVLVSAQLVIQLTNVPIVRTDFVLSYILFTFLLWAVYRLKSGRAKQKFCMKRVKDNNV